MSFDMRKHSAPLDLTRTQILAFRRSVQALDEPRVWPGAVLVAGEIVGTWRRANAVVTVEPWRHLSGADREAVEREAASLPLPGLRGPIVVRWAS